MAETKDGPCILTHSCRGLLALLVGWGLLLLPSNARAQESILTFSPAETRIEYGLGAALHSVHGTFQLRSGEIRFDPATGALSGTVIVDASSGESGNSSRDSRMHREIIESQKFPEIVLILDHAKGPLAEIFSLQKASVVEVSGILRLHGQDHEMTLAVMAQPAAGQLQVSSRFVIPYVQWGLRNPNTFLLHVSPTVDINILATGRIVSAAPGSR